MTYTQHEYVLDQARQRGWAVTAPVASATGFLICETLTRAGHRLDTFWDRGGYLKAVDRRLRDGATVPAQLGPNLVMGLLAHLTQGQDQRPFSAGELNKLDEDMSWYDDPQAPDWVYE